MQNKFYFSLDYSGHNKESSVCVSRVKQSSKHYKIKTDSRRKRVKEIFFELANQPQGGKTKIVFHPNTDDSFSVVYYPEW